MPVPVCRFARACFCRRFRGEARYGKKIIARCGHPSETFLLLDKGSGALFTPWFNWQSRAQAAPDAFNSDATFYGRTPVPGPHSGGKNVAFADRHVKYLPCTAIVSRDQNAASGVTADVRSSYYSYFEN